MTQKSILFDGHTSSDAQLTEANEGHQEARGIPVKQHEAEVQAKKHRERNLITSTCSAKVSDWIGEAPLLRIDEVHHKIALFPAMRHGVQHINHQVAGFDDVMRSYYFLREQGVHIRFGPGRHPTSGAMFLYFEGPDGMTYEYSTGVRMISADSDYRPRQFPFRSSSFCMWGSKPDIPEFKT